MTCCKGSECCKAKTVERTDELLAANFGIDSTWIAEVISKYGADALALVVECLRSGFTRELVIEVINKWGPQVLAFLLTVYNSSKSMSLKDEKGNVIVGDVVPGVDESVLLALVQQWLPALMQYLPQLLSQYGDQISQAITPILDQLLAQYASDIVQALLKAILTSKTT